MLIHWSHCLQWRSVILFNMLVAPPFKGVIHSLDRSISSASEVLVSTSYKFLRFTNSPLMFYFILFIFIIKCTKKIKVLQKYITGFTTDIYISLPYYHSKVGMLITFPKLFWLHWNEARLIELIWRIKAAVHFMQSCSHYQCSCVMLLNRINAGGVMCLLLCVCVCVINALLTLSSVSTCASAPALTPALTLASSIDSVAF